MLGCLLAGPALAQGAPPRGGQDVQFPAYADPSKVIAAELAFAQMAQEKGQWTAFAATAAPDAVMFTPHMVYARQWLKDRANPPVAVKWQPHKVWSSCDGSLMVSSGAWQRPGSTGFFTTVWQRQSDGGYQWVLDHGDVLSQPLAAPEMISARVADCPDRARRSGGQQRGKAARPQRTSGRSLPPLNPARRTGRSDDGTLTWQVTVDPSGARNFSVEWKKDGSIQPATIEEVAAPAEVRR